MIKTPIERAHFIESEFKKYIRSTFSMRDNEFDELISHQLQNADIFKGPYLSKQNPFLPSKSLYQLINEKEINLNFKLLLQDNPDHLKRPLYAHQLKSICKINKGKSVVISTGTGSGKTESFLYPIINYLLNDKNLEKPGIRALFLYPMNALLNDQMERLRELLKDHPNIKYGVYTGDTEHESTIEPKYSNELMSREEIQSNPPHILFTNYSMLEYMLIRPQESHMFLSNRSLEKWKFVVLDEAHTYRGASAIEMSLLLRRLTGFASNPIQYILTSATLGDETNPDNLKEIVHFANNLTGASFNSDDIVFASYKEIKLYNTTSYNDDDYLRMYNDLRNYPEKSSEYLDYFRNSVHIYKIYNLLKTPTLYNDIKNATKLSDQALNALFESISIINAQTNELFDLKYHSFVRSLEGAFMTFVPEKNIRLTRHKKINNLIAFESGNCKYCNTIYLLGKVVGDKFLQSKDVDIYEHYDEEFLSKQVDFFVVKDSIDIGLNTDEIDNQLHRPHTLCNNCGHIYDNSEINPIQCGCGSQFHFEVIKVDKKNINVNNLSTCIVCNNSSRKTGVIQSFNIGKDQSTALIGQMLYKSMPKTGEKGFKKFIAFSDGRQQASHFASFFKYNHERFLRKRLLLEVLRKNPNTSLNLNDLINHLVHIISEYNLADNDIDIKSLAWLTVLYDLLYVDGKNSGQGLGLFSFDLNIKLKPEIIEKIEQDVMDNYGINYNEFITLVKIILERFRYYPAINYISGLKEDDKDVLEYRSKFFDVYYKSSSKLGHNAKNFSSANGINNNEKFLKKHFTNKFDKILKDIWEFSVEHVFINSHTGGFNIPINKYLFKPVENFYVCSHCGKTSNYSFKNICSSPDCNGSLCLKKPSEYFEKNYYYNEYIKKNIEKIIAKEHTGQIDRKKAKSYQDEFNNNKINVLSSSTTFEMGLDIDKLSTVFLRNVPPLPSNYVQRAGRAGRQSGVSAFVLTFCSANSHDYTFFQDPIKMISGKIRPPYFKISNEKILIRHLLAASIGMFYSDHLYSSSFNTIKDFVDSLDTFIKYMETKPSILIDYIDKHILPKELLDQYGKLKWFNIPETGGLAKINSFKNDIKSEVSELEEIKHKLFSDGKYEDLKYFDNLLKSISENKNLIKAMSNGGLIPKHGFPVDVVNLDIKSSDSKNKDTDKDLSRDLQIAISEYAPESEVIVDDRIYKSKYVNIPRSKSLTKQYYHQCKVCGDITLNKIEINSCKHCNTAFTDRIPPFIIPEYGFTTDGTNRSAKNSRKPKKTYSGSVVYLDQGNRDLGPTKFTIDAKEAFVESFNDDELLILNESQFYICPTCGYTEINESSHHHTLNREHRTKTGYTCNTSLQRMNIGYILKTDVTKLTMSFPGYSKQKLKDKATSLLFALLEGISKTFEVERNDISGVIGKIDDESNVDLIIYDTVPGGAGHSKRLFDYENLIAAFKTSYYTIQNNCCDVETSCYNCLRNYYNRKIHDQLRRIDAIDLLEQIVHH